MKKTYYLSALVLFIFFIGILSWWKSGVGEVNPADKSQKIFVIRKGEGLKVIADNLKKEGLIKNPFVFIVYVKIQGFDGKIQAGDFRLSPSMTAKDIASNLTHGTLDIWITIPEGKRADEVADTLKKSLIMYNDRWRLELDANEGYLFPDTYLFPKEATIQMIAQSMKKNFSTKYQEVEKIKKVNQPQADIVIIASLIEREAKHPQDRPVIASVIYNRLVLGMPLQIDATVQYAIGYEQNAKTWWKKDLTIADLKIQSAYNTYLRIGLPPGPIANPGLSSLKAAANPAKTDYLYYISDKQGNNHYAKTLDEHNANIKKYGL